MTGWTWIDPAGWVMPDGTPLVPDRARRVYRERLEAAYRLTVIAGRPPAV